LDTIIETAGYFIGFFIQKVFLHPIKKKYKKLSFYIDLIEIFVPLFIFIVWRYIYVIFEIIFSMANEFSKASFVAARRLYFEQIAANTNPPIDGRINNDTRLKRNAISEGNITEDSISSPLLEYHSTLHKAISHSSLIPRKNDRSKLFNSGSKIPIPESHSPLIKSINVDSEDNKLSSNSTSINKQVNQNQKEINHNTNKLERINSESSPKIQILDEIPAVPPIKPAKKSSPLLKSSKSSPLIYANSKLPIPTSHKSSKDVINQNEYMNKSNGDIDENKNSDKENKGWFIFTKERWFTMAKEKVSNSANNWLSISKPKSEQFEDFSQYEDNEVNNDNNNKEEKSELVIIENDDINSRNDEVKDEEINKSEEKYITKSTSIKQVNSPDQSPALVVDVEETSSKVQSSVYSPIEEKVKPQEKPLSPVDMRPISSMQMRPKSPIMMKPISPTQSRTESPVEMRPLSPTESELESTIEIKPKTSEPVKVKSTSQSSIQIRAKTPVYLPSEVIVPVRAQSQLPAQSSIQQQQSNNKIESTKEKIDSKILSTTNEEIKKSPSIKSFNKIFNNTQNFMYKNTNLSLSNQSLNSSTSTNNTEKFDESNATVTGDELIIDDKELASATIAFDKKVLQKIDNSIPQERNDNEVMNKIQRKKRTSFGSSSLSKTIDENNEDNNISFKNNTIEEESMKLKSESIRDSPMYKYLRAKNDISYQNFNTTLNKYEDDSDASYDSDGYTSTDTESKKESFESKLKKKSKYFINGRKKSIGDKNNNNNGNQSKIAVVSNKIKPSLPVPTLPARKSSTSSLTKKIVQESNTVPSTSKQINSNHIGTTVPSASPPLRSVSTSSNSSLVRATSPLTMYSRVNDNLDVDMKPKNYNIIKTEPVTIENKPEKPERILKYKPPRRTSSSLNRNSKHTRNKNSQDLSINELSALVIDAPPERGRSIFKEAREFSNKSHSIDTELSRRGGNGRESRNRSPDYRMRPGTAERSRGRTRDSIHFDMDDDEENTTLVYTKGINTRKYLKKYLNRREGQRSQSVDASKSKSNNHRRNDSDEYLKIQDENEDSLYITELLNSNFMDQDNDKDNIFFSNKLNQEISLNRQEKRTSIISSNSSISSSCSSSSASSMTTSTNTTSVTDTSRNSYNNNKTLVNDAPIDSYYKISGVIKKVVPIGSNSLLYGSDDSYNSRNKNTLYTSRSSVTLNRYSYQKTNRNSINSTQSNKRISRTSSFINDDDTSLIFGNLPEEIYNFLKPELEIPPPTRISSRESIQSSTDSKHQSLSSLHQSLTLNDESDNDEVTLRNNSTRLQASIIKGEETIPKPLSNAQKRMEKITSEILSTERTYVNELKNLINIYIEPLRKNNLLELEEFNSVFANIEDIYKFHEKSFLPPLESVCQSNDAKISKFFLDISNSFESIYSKYYYAFNGANTLLTLVQSNNHHNVRIPSLSSSSFILNLPIFERSNKKRLKKFKNFLKNCASRPDHTQLSLQGYLILPVQRLPRYLLLLEQLVKYSKDDPVEKEEYEKAAELMKNVVASCNSYMKQCEEKHILLEITTKHIRLDSNDSRGEMVDNYIKIQGLVRVPGAKVVRKGDLKILRSVTSDASIFPCKDIVNRRLSNDYVSRNPNLINPNIRCSSALSMATTTTTSSSRTYYDPKNNGSRLSSSNESIHSVSTNNTYVQQPSMPNPYYKRNSTSVIDIKKNQTTDSIGMFYLIHNLFIYCKLNGILVNVLDLEECTVEPASFSSTSSEFVEIESNKTDIVLIVSDSKTQLYLTSPDIDSVYSWHQTINKQWKALKKIDK